FVQLGQELLDQRGLTRSDLAGDHDETVAVPHGVVHVGFGARMRLAHIDELGIGREPEGKFAKLEKFEVHRFYLTSGVYSRPVLYNKVTKNRSSTNSEAESVLVRSTRRASMPRVRLRRATYVMRRPICLSVSRRGISTYLALR